MAIKETSIQLASCWSSPERGYKISLSQVSRDKYVALISAIYTSLYQICVSVYTLCFTYSFDHICSMDDDLGEAVVSE